MYGHTNNLGSYHLEQPIMNDQETVSSPLLSTQITLSLFPQSDSVKQNMTNVPPQIFATADSVLVQALPPSLATLEGWDSEIVAESSDISADARATSTSFVDKDDTSPITYSPIKEVNRVIHGIPTSTIHVPEKTSKIVNTSYQTKEQEVLINSVAGQSSSPIVIHKQVPCNKVTYEQNISVRYLQPPTPPPHGPIIIREICPPPPPPKSPIRIRQRPRPPTTPPPLILREKPPPVPPRSPLRIVEKCLPPPPRPPRRVIVERLPACPPKPANVFIERWLPYKRSDQRRIFFERTSTISKPPQPNLLIIHDQPKIRIQKQFINEGIIRADPQSYLQEHGPELKSREPYSQYADIFDEAVRTLQAPSQPYVQTDNKPNPHWEHHPPSSSSIVQQPLPPSQLPPVWDRMQSVPAIHTPSSMSYYNDNSSNPCSGRSFQRDEYNSDYRYDAYKVNKGDFKTMVDVTPSWNHRCASRSSRFSSSPSHSFHKTQVNSDQELYQVLSELTNSHVPSSFRSYYE